MFLAAFVGLGLSLLVIRAVNRGGKNQLSMLVTPAVVLFRRLQRVFVSVRVSHASFFAEFSRKCANF